VEPHPVQLSVGGDFERTRAAVFFRLILVIPLAVWLVLWTIAMLFVAVVNWFVTLFTGTPAAGLMAFTCSYIRFAAHVESYFWLLADPYPRFEGRAGDYVVDIELPTAPTAQSRWVTFFRIFLALPALILTGVLGTGSSSNSTRGQTRYRAPGLLLTVGVLGWFASLFTGRMPKGLRDAGVYSVGYSAQTLAYLLFVTDRFPSADPTAMLASVDPPPVHPVRIADQDDLRRSRLTVFFRLLLAIPHFVWLILWGIAFVFSVLANWFVTLFRGTPAGSLHRFNARYLRYAIHVYAFFLLVANPFPGFTGVAGSYPVDLVLPEPTRQNRWKTGFRLVLFIPAGIVAGALGWGLYVTAVFTWFYSLVRGQAPDGMHKLALYALRYLAQADAYVYLLTDAYPNASPLEGAEPAPEPEPTAEPQYAW